MSARETNDDPVLEPRKQNRLRWARFSRSSKGVRTTASEASSGGDGDVKARPEKWSMGILNDTETDEVPGTSYDTMTTFL